MDSSEFEKLSKEHEIELRTRKRVKARGARAVANAKASLKVAANA